MKNKSKTSIAKIKANRKNALQSTGPKTDDGKKVVKWNALKHGLLSEEVVIRAGDGQENIDDFRALLGQLRVDLQPEGILEEILVEKIAICYWRLRRVLRCEIGEIRKESDTATWQEFMRRADHVNRDKGFLMVDSARQDLKKSSLGIQYLIGILDDIKTGVERDGHLSEKARKQLLENFGNQDGGITETCFFLHLLMTEDQEASEQEPGEIDDRPSPAKGKKMLLKVINDEKKILQQLKEVIEENENLELEAHIASLALPRREVVEKILRYETTIERQLYRAINQLERLQRQRKGEPVPPPVSLDISTQS